MTRTPLRPLARILVARARGENPDHIEKENLHLRNEEIRDRVRVQSETRIQLLVVAFIAAFVLIGGRMTLLASSEPAEPRGPSGGVAISAQRGDIVDRQGRLLATNLITHSLYAHPHEMVDKAKAARELARIFPDLEAEDLLEDFTGSRRFLWVKTKLSPEQVQAVHDIGEPGLNFGPREMRLYPNGRLAAHVLGGATFGKQGVRFAEVIGTAGVEKEFDGYLRDPANGGTPLQLSLDLSVQAAVERILGGGMALMNARGAAAVLMDANTGEVISLVSLPDFDPNTRPRPPVTGEPADSPLFNRAVQGVYELGSTFKIFTAAQALELGLVNPKTKVDTKGPLTWGRHRIRDFHNYGPELSVTDIIVKSSNIGTARLALQIGGVRQKAFLDQLGFLAPTPLELVEAPTGRPQFPSDWKEISTMTISYGHGLSSSPLHLAAGYAAMVNGGRMVKPTLLKTDHAALGPRVISERTSAAARDMLRQVVVRGTASFGEVPGYAVGGKTGTADKPKPQGGGYYRDKVISTFASVFPAHNPEYVLIVTLDEPVETSGPEPRRTAGWTAVPIAAEIIRRTAPLLGLAPTVEPLEPVHVTLTSN